MGGVEKWDWSQNEGEVKMVQKERKAEVLGKKNGDVQIEKKKKDGTIKRYDNE